MIEFERKYYVPLVLSVNTLGSQVCFAEGPPRMGLVLKGSRCILNLKPKNAKHLMKAFIRNKVDNTIF